MSYQIPDTVLTRVVSGELVMLDMRTEKYFALDEIGAQVVDGLKAEENPAEIAAKIAAEYDADPSQIEQDVEALIAQMMEQGLIARAA